MERLLFRTGVTRGVADGRRWVGRGRRVVVPLLAAMLAVAQAACGSTASSGAKSGGKPSTAASASSSGAAAPASQGKAGATGTPVTFVIEGPLTGPSGQFGIQDAEVAKTACQMITQAGGILGHPCHLTSVDGKNDAADAVPVVRQAILTATNLVALVGPGSSEGPAVIPVGASAKIPIFAQAGESTYVHSGIPYLFMMDPPDELQGGAMAVYAYNLGIHHAALVFDNSPDALPIEQGVQAMYPRVGGKVAITLNVAPTQSSYGTEVERLVNAHADGIITEMDPQTAGTFFTDLAQLAGIKTMIVTDGTANHSSWYKAVVHGVGATTLANKLRMVQVGAKLSGPAANIFVKALAKGYPKMRADAHRGAFYDALNIVGLAIDEAHSIQVKTFLPYIMKVALKQPGAVTVYSYAQGLAAIKKGKTVYYDGATGPMLWTKDHARTSPFGVLKYGVKGNIIQTSTLIPAAKVEPLLQ